MIIAIGQLLFAVSTLYRTRGNQLAQFGYAAFGLTVTQYAWMSLINFSALMICPQYSSLFVVESSALDTLRGIVQAGEFPLTGAVGRITPETERNLQKDHDLARGQKRPPLIDASRLIFLSRSVVLAYAVPIAIIGGISRFSPGSSEAYQRVLVMLWLIWGMQGLSYLVILEALFDSRPVIKLSAPRANVNSILLTLFYYSAPAIAGFVVVGKMINEYGVCYEI
jgi:hypothetical protein